MKKKNQNELVDFNEYIDHKYGKEGTPKREKWEAGFETFKIGVILEQARLKSGMTQEELATKCGTNKSYISRIEHDASDIKLSTLIKIIKVGLGGELKLIMPY
jgi:HTH-type transcriptional regulator / antitoxin HipB